MARQAFTPVWASVYAAVFGVAMDPRTDEWQRRAAVELLDRLAEERFPTARRRVQKPRRPENATFEHLIRETIADRLKPPDREGR